MQRTAWDWAIVATTASIVFFTNLGGPRLWDRDEPRNAGCAREMLAAGDWVTPVFNAELRAHKPVLLYWLIMSAYAALGVSEFAARFWSAALAIGTVLATYHIGRRLFHRRAGVWAGVILATALMFDVAARAATPDSVLIFFSTLAILVYVLTVFAPKEECEQNAAPRLREEEAYFPRWPAAALMYALMGAAVLAKGPVGLVLPTAVIGMFLLIVTLPTREGLPWWMKILRPFAPRHFLRTCRRMRPLTAIAVAIAVAAPWYVWVHLRTGGAFTEDFFFTHNFGRAAAPMEGHDGSLLFYPAAILVGFFPWSVFAAPVLIDLVLRLRRRHPWSVGLTFAACWVGVYVGLFSLAQTKLPSYITPMYPALALITGCFIHHWTRGAAEVAKLWPRLAMAALGLVGAAMAIAIPLAARELAPGEEMLGALGLIPLAAAGLCCFLMERGRVAAAARVFAAAAVLFTTTIFGYGAMRADRHQHSDLLLAAIALESDEPQLAAYGCLEPSWVFYAGRPIREIDRTQLTDHEAGVLAGEDAFVITTRRRLGEIAADLPPHTYLVAEAPYFMKDEQLVVLSRSRPSFADRPAAAKIQR
ncbi:MAG: glycosyltransferase family 39 protein [Planctomycetes bacterium]|nr:glycosyltransferase family 39 protein [Planctomycetota bacterium]